MTDDQTNPPPSANPDFQADQPQPGQPDLGGPGVAPSGQQVYAATAMPVVVGPAPLGKRRSSGIVILLTFVTCGIWAYIWSFQTGDELKNFRGQGQGGMVYLLLTMFIPPVTMFLLPGEIESAYNERGQASPVSTTLGLWFLLPLIGNIIWYVKVQDALNDYWTMLGQTNDPSY